MQCDAAAVGIKPLRGLIEGLRVLLTRPHEGELPLTVTGLGGGLGLAATAGLGARADRGATVELSDPMSRRALDCGLLDKGSTLS